MSASKFSVLGVQISATTYAEATGQITAAAAAHQGMTVAALAVHGVILATLNSELRYRFNQFDFTTPDGQPVRWALRLLHGVQLPDRVYGPTLMLKLCEAAQEQALRIYLYGSSADTTEALKAHLHSRFPALDICGAEPSKFRMLTEQEHTHMVEQIAASGAQMVFVGMGCPRQEIWMYEVHGRLHIPIIAVGAAFDFLSGVKQQAPYWMQARGLEWLFRLLQEPTRLWQRYLLLNPLYLLLLSLQWFGLKRFDTEGTLPRSFSRYG
jgi:N-acetylglucosaminyldiphosphoundecaprenol N-acetyl-beta-D-mannosaminyltransferase